MFRGGGGTDLHENGILKVSLLSQLCNHTHLESIDNILRYLLPFTEQLRNRESVDSSKTIYVSVTNVATKLLRAVNLAACI